VARPKEEKGSDRLLTNLLLLGGLYLINSKGSLLSGQAKQADISIQPVAVFGGERVSADSYRRISKKRPGMDYIYADGYLGGRITFDVKKNGVFTRNVVLEDGVLKAELKYT
jgi:hypothetical protein